VKRLALLGLAFLLALAVTALPGCPRPIPGNDDGQGDACSESYDLGEAAGYDKGYELGKARGYDKGYLEGKAEGEQGYEQGYDAGYAKGWQEGFAEGQKECEDHRYVGSVKSDVYHYPDCEYVAEIYPQNRIWFTSAEDARSQGYRPCKVCKPPG